MWVVTNGPNIIGSIIGHSIGKDGYISTFYIEEEHRGKGLGKHLLNSQLSQMKKSGMERCHLITQANNQKSMNLYEKLGFELKGIVENQYKGDIDAVDLCLNLKYY